MGAVSNQQVYDLLLEVSDDLAGLDASVDELLADMRTFNQELEAGRRELAEARNVLAKGRALLT
jgi:outer membrane murein-binding lipoprotein Lpp